MNTSWLELEGKVAIVTGGASGIGLSIADELRKNGAKVVVSDLNVEEGPQDEDDGDGYADKRKQDALTHMMFSFSSMGQTPRAAGSFRGACE